MCSIFLRFEFELECPFFDSGPFFKFRRIYPLSLSVRSLCNLSPHLSSFHQISSDLYCVSCGLALVNISHVLSSKLTFLFYFILFKYCFPRILWHWIHSDFFAISDFSPLFSHCRICQPSSSPRPSLLSLYAAQGNLLYHFRSTSTLKHSKFTYGTVKLPLNSKFPTYLPTPLQHLSCIFIWIYLKFNLESFLQNIALISALDGDTIQ